MHLVSPTDGADISIVAAGEPFETLMDDYFMYNKISEAIKRNAKADICNKIVSMLQSQLGMA